MVVSVDSGLSQPIHGFQLIEARETVIPLQLIQPIVPLQQGQRTRILNHAHREKILGKCISRNVLNSVAEPLNILWDPAAHVPARLRLVP
jgi:hypothetical protein